MLLTWPRWMPHRRPDAASNHAAAAAAAASQLQLRALRHRELWCVTPAANARLRCLRGSVWVTADGDCRDFVLEAAESMLARAGLPLIVYALEDSWVQCDSAASLTLPPDPAAAPPFRAGAAFGL